MAKSKIERKKVNSDDFSLLDFVSVKSKDLFKKVEMFSDFLVDASQKGYADSYLQTVTSPSSNVINIIENKKTREVIQMNTANYLGLAAHPFVISESKKILDVYGASICSVPLISGTTEIHKLLEKKLAEFKKVDDVALFQTGYLANIGTISAVVSSRDWVVIDRDVHYSIVEGVKISGANFSRFRHSDCEHLEKVLKRIREKHNDIGILVVIEGVYGIDGDIAPLPDIINICEKYTAKIMIDDAHSTGILGENGAGLISHFGVEGKVDIVMDSLSKSLGSFGGYIGASKEVINYLRFYSKPISFSVNLPPVCVAAALATIKLIEDDRSFVERLRKNADFMRNELSNLGLKNVDKSSSTIMSIIIGDEVKLRQITHELLEKGLWIEGIPYPAVQRGQERIRLRVNANHTMDDLKNAILIFKVVLTKYGIIN